METLNTPASVAQNQHQKSNESSLLMHNDTLQIQTLKFQELISQLKVKGQIPRKCLLQLIKMTQHTLQNQPNTLSIKSPVKIVGDIHGQFYDLLYILQTFKAPYHYKSTNRRQLEKCQFLFLGDYVDRGLFCIEVMVLLMALKCKYPKLIHLLRGNHEGKTMSQCFNFRLECLKKYDVQIYERFLELFCTLPLAAIIDDKYFAVHGGISPQLKKLIIEDLNSINRFKQIENNGLICDLVWSDPSNSNNFKWQKNKTRSCSYVYNRKQAHKFLEQNKIKMIIRGHQVQMNGFSYQTTQYKQKLTLTIFSAPNYCDTYKNKGGIAIIDKGFISIQNFTQQQHPFVFPNYANLFQWSVPMIATHTSKMFLKLLKYVQQRKRRSTIILGSRQQNSSTAEKDQKSQRYIVDKLQKVNELLQCKGMENLSLLLSTKQSPQMSSDPDNLDLSNSNDKETKKESQISNVFKLFTMKKQNDINQKYPHEPAKIIGPKYNSSQIYKYNDIHYIQEEQVDTGIQSQKQLNPNKDDQNEKSKKNAQIERQPKKKVSFVGYEQQQEQDCEINQQQTKEQKAKSKFNKKRVSRRSSKKKIKS